MSDDDRHFANWASYNEYRRNNPSADDPVVQLLPLVDSDDMQRWAKVGRQIEARMPDMGRAEAVASVRADLEAGRL